MTASDRPPTVEMPPEDPSTLRQWGQLLAGPVLFMVDFGLVYLPAEAVCAAEREPAFAFFDPASLTTWIMAVTLVGTVAVVLTTWWAWRSVARASGSRRQFAWAGVLLGVGSAFAILAIGVPVLVLDPCGP
jgi:uncharacterized membrane protein